MMDDSAPKHEKRKLIKMFSIENGLWMHKYAGRPTPNNYDKNGVENGNRRNYSNQPPKYKGESVGLTNRSAVYVGNEYNYDYHYTLYLSLSLF